MNQFQTFYQPIQDTEQYFIVYPATKPSDTAVIFLHGGPGESSAHFLYLTRPTQQSYHFVYYDQRGTGKTQIRNHAKKATVTVTQLVQDLADTITFVKEQYAVKHIILWGHSWGTVLGLCYLQQYPNSVSAYLGMGQVVSFKAGEQCAYQHCYELVRQSGLAKDLKALDKLQHYPDGTLRQLRAFRQIQMKYHLAGMEGGTKKILALMKKSPIYHWKDLWVMLSAPKVNQQLLDFVFQYDTSAIQHYDCPFYLLSGRQDWQVPGLCAYQYYESIIAPDKAFFWIENAGHSTDLDQPQAVNQVLEEICQRVRERSSQI